MSRLVACIYCGYQDERTELMPVDDRTLFGDLVNPNTGWYCSDCADTWAEKTGRMVARRNDIYRRLGQAEADRGEGKSGTTEQRDLIKSIRQELEDFWRAREPDYPRR